MELNRTLATGFCWQEFLPMVEQQQQAFHPNISVFFFPLCCPSNYSVCGEILNFSNQWNSVKGAKCGGKQNFS